MSAAPTRRAALAGALAAATGAPAAEGRSPPRIVALEWGIVSMLLSIRIVPVGIGETEPYRTWVSAPPLPPGIVDVGIRTEPNLEALAALRPDVILTSPLSRSIRPLIERVAPVRELAVYTEEHAPLRLLERELRALARDWGRPEEAERVVAEAAEAFSRARTRLAPFADRPLVLANAVDPRHLRVFGPGSLFHDVLGRIGCRNAWTRPGNAWGFELVGIEQLARHPGARIVVVEPVPPDVRLRPAGASLWASLPAVRAGLVSVLPAVWPFGDLVAAQRFAALLASALDPAGEAGAGR